VGRLVSCPAGKGARTALCNVYGLLEISFCNDRSTWVEIIEPLHRGIHVAPVHLPTTPPHCAAAASFQPSPPASNNQSVKQMCRTSGGSPHRGANRHAIGDGRHVYIHLLARCRFVKASERATTEGEDERGKASKEVVKTLTTAAPRAPNLEACVTSKLLGRVLEMGAHNRVQCTQSCRSAQLRVATLIWDRTSVGETRSRLQPSSALFWPEDPGAHLVALDHKEVEHKTVEVVLGHLCIRHALLPVASMGVWLIRWCAPMGARRALCGSTEQVCAPLGHLDAGRGL
jgi:hypothetical protein